MSEKLTGQSLVSKLKILTRLSDEEKAKACGYYKIGKDGKETVHLKEFLSAVLAATGFSEIASKEIGKRGRQPNTELKVNTSGQIVVSGAHLSQIGLQPGDKASVVVGRNRVILQAIKSGKGGEEEETEEQSLAAEMKELTAQVERNEKNGVGQKKLAIA